MYHRDLELKNETMRSLAWRIREWTPMLRAKNIAQQKLRDKVRTSNSLQALFKRIMLSLLLFFVGSSLSLELENISIILTHVAFKTKIHNSNWSSNEHPSPQIDSDSVGSEGCLPGRAETAGRRGKAEIVSESLRGRCFSAKAQLRLLLLCMIVCRHRMYVSHACVHIHSRPRKRFGS